MLFRNPIGFRTEDKGFFTLRGTGAGFITLTPPADGVIDWMSGLKARFPGEIAIVDIREDIHRNFSLSYDFADIIVIDPEAKAGIESLDISDTISLMDSLLNLRLCYEKYTPVYLRLSAGATPDEVKTLVSFCQLSGIDGIVAPGASRVALVKQLSLGRIAIMGTAETPEEAMELLENGASLVELNATVISLQKLLKSLSDK